MGCTISFLYESDYQNECEQDNAAVPRPAQGLWQQPSGSDVDQQQTRSEFEPRHQQGQGQVLPGHHRADTQLVVFPTAPYPAGASRGNGQGGRAGDVSPVSMESTHGEKINRRATTSKIRQQYGLPPRRRGSAVMDAIID